MGNKGTTLIVTVALLGLLIAADAARFEDTMIKRLKDDGTCVPTGFVQNVGYQTGCIPGTEHKCCEGSYCEPRYYRGYWTFYCTTCDSAWNPEACNAAIGK